MISEHVYEVVDLNTGEVLWGEPSEELLELLVVGVACNATLEQCSRYCAIWFPSTDENDPLVFVREAAPAAVEAACAAA